MDDGGAGRHVCVLLAAWSKFTRQCRPFRVSVDHFVCLLYLLRFDLCLGLKRNLIWRSLPRIPAPPTCQCMTAHDGGGVAHPRGGLFRVWARSFSGATLAGTGLGDWTVDMQMRGAVAVWHCVGVCRHTNLPGHAPWCVGVWVCGVWWFVWM